jgi:hypothetical protein
MMVSHYTIQRSGREAGSARRCRSERPWHHGYKGSAEMTISPETEVVSTRHDAAARVSYYTIERSGRRWTVAIPDSDLDKHGYKKGHEILRRNHLANVLTMAMAGKADGE